MTAIIDRRQVAADLRANLASRVHEMKQSGVASGSGVGLAGDDHASRSYATVEEMSCHDLEMLSQDLRLSANISERKISLAIDSA